MSSSTLLRPTPGFCVKTKTVQSGSFLPEKPDGSDSVLSVSASIQVPINLKVFVNMAWDDNVPPPPEANEAAIQAAMQGEVDPNDADAWYVPLVVSGGREDLDKAGKPSLVFDAIFNASLKTRVSKDPTFKLFLVELALQRIEAQASLLLSREIVTPKLPSKGPLAPRTISLPTLSPKPESAPSKQKKKTLIEEIKPPTKTPPASILKQPSSPQKTSGLRAPSWTRAMSGSSLQLTVQVPELTRSHISTATLDLEPHRLILSIPPLYALDLSTSQVYPVSPSEKREFDVDGAKAEWRVAEGVLVINA